MKYIKYSLLAALGFLFAQCTEEGDKTYPQQPAPQWSVVEEDFVSEAPAWQVADNAPASAPGWRADFTGRSPSNSKLSFMWNSFTSSITLSTSLTPLTDNASICTGIKILLAATKAL